MRASVVALITALLWIISLSVLVIVTDDSPLLPVFMGLAGFFTGVGLICAAIENKE